MVAFQQSITIVMAVADAVADVSVSVAVAVAAVERTSRRTRWWRCSGVNRTQLQAAVLACTMERDKLVGSNPTMLVAVPGYLASGGQLDPDFSDLLAGGSLGPSWGKRAPAHFASELLVGAAQAP